MPDFPFPWQWWNGDYRVRGLTSEQRGRLMDALSYSVDSPTPGVFGEEELRGLLGLDPQEWVDQRARFEPLFSVRRGGRWVQTEFRAAYVRQFERISARSKAARAAARKKWLDAALEASGDASGMRSHCDRMHTHQHQHQGVECNSTTVPDSESDAELDRRLNQVADRLERRTTPPPGRVLEPRAATPADLLGTVTARLARGGSG